MKHFRRFQMFQEFTGNTCSLKIPKQIVCCFFVLPLAVFQIYHDSKWIWLFVQNTENLTETYDNILRNANFEISDTWFQSKSVLSTLQRNSVDFHYYKLLSPYAQPFIRIFFGNLFPSTKKFSRNFWWCWRHLIKMTFSSFLHRRDSY